MNNKKGETDLQVLLENMEPKLEDKELVFCSLPPEQSEKYIPDCQGYYLEPEGVTLILDRQLADQENLSNDLVFKRISLMVHSSLDAVGFLAKVTEILAAQGIPVNVVSAYYHDHLYVKADQAENAFDILKLWQNKLKE
ncbi:MAG: ACT domain-containing protein [Anaerolineales bacterium]